MRVAFVSLIRVAAQLHGIGAILLTQVTSIEDAFCLVIQLSYSVDNSLIVLRWHPFDFFLERNHHFF